MQMLKPLAGTKYEYIKEKHVNYVLKSGILALKA